MLGHGAARRRYVTASAVTGLMLVLVVRALDGTGPVVVPVWLDVVVAIGFVASGLALVNTPAIRTNGWLLIAAGWLLFPRTLLGSFDAWTFTLAVLFELAWLGPLIHFIMTGTQPLRGRPFAIAAVSLTYLHVAVIRVLYLMFHFRREQPDIPENLLKVAGSHPSFDWVEPAAGYLPAVIGAIALLALLQQFRTSAPAARERWLPVYAASVVVTAIVIANPIIANAFSPGALTNVLQAEQLALLFLAIAVLSVVAADMLAHRTLVDVAAAAGRGGDLAPTIQAALRDPTAVVIEADVGGPYPGRCHIPLSVGATRVGTLDVDELTIADPMVPSVASFLAVALAHQQLARQVEAQLAEVEDSRNRLVQAADAERRRIERDLHDGVQQLLLSVGMQLSLALLAAQREGAVQASERVAEARTQLQAATGEVRRLVHGLVPSALADLGLAAAVDQLAERSPIPVQISIDLSRRLPSVVEATAYFVVGEALTNAIRHADATGIRIRVHDCGASLEIDVADDGIGGARTDAGSGLVGLRDRVAAIGGSLDVISPQLDGTCLRLQLPTSQS